MGAYWLHDLPQILGGLSNVSTYQGWESRSRSSGGYDGVFGIAIHHTASNTSPENDMYYQWVSSSDGPIGAIYLGRDGRIVIGAAGATNCQGKGGPLHTSKGTIPLDKGNQYMIAIEAANAGTGEPWPQIQTDQFVAVVRALSDGYGFNPYSDVYGHYDYCAPSCPGRKIDPAGPSPFGAVNQNDTWDINVFRNAVAAGGPPPPEEDDMNTPASVWLGNGRLDNFVRGDDGALWHNWYTPGIGWSPWESLGGQLVSSPSATVSEGYVRIDVTGHGTDDGLWHIWWDGGAWSVWERVADWPG